MFFIYWIYEESECYSKYVGKLGAFFPWSVRFIFLQVTNMDGSNLANKTLLKIEGGEYMNKNLRNGLIAIVVGLIIWFIPTPAGLKPQAWHLFAVFTATILGFILQPLPIGAAPSSR